MVIVIVVIIVIIAPIVCNIICCVAEELPLISSTFALKVKPKSSRCMSELLSCDDEERHYCHGTSTFNNYVILLDFAIYVDAEFENLVSSSQMLIISGMCVFHCEMAFYSTCFPEAAHLKIK